MVKTKRCQECTVGEFRSLRVNIASPRESQLGVTPGPLRTAKTHCALPSDPLKEHLQHQEPSAFDMLEAEYNTLKNQAMRGNSVGRIPRLWPASVLELCKPLHTPDHRLRQRLRQCKTADFLPVSTTRSKARAGECGSTSIQNPIEISLSRSVHFEVM